MKKLSLEQMHACALEIFKDIDRFCRDNDIRYSMAFGTLLGAVRHKGFDLIVPAPCPNLCINEFLDERVVKTGGYEKASEDYAQFLYALDKNKEIEKIA